MNENLFLQQLSFKIDYIESKHMTCTLKKLESVNVPTANSFWSEEIRTLKTQSET